MKEKDEMDQKQNEAAKCVQTDKNRSPWIGRPYGFTMILFLFLRPQMSDFYSNFEGILYISILPFQ